MRQFFATQLHTVVSTPFCPTAQRLQITVTSLHPMHTVVYVDSGLLTLRCSESQAAVIRSVSSDVELGSLAVLLYSSCSW